MKSKNLLLWLCRIVAVIIMLQTLYSKFIGTPESVYIFTQVDMEPEGRIATAIAELVACILILIPGTSLIGASLALFIMIGAIATHVSILGIEVIDDHARHFIFAVIVAITSFYIILRYTKKRKKVAV